MKTTLIPECQVMRIGYLKKTTVDGKCVWAWCAHPNRRVSVKDARRIIEEPQKLL